MAIINDIPLDQSEYGMPINGAYHRIVGVRIERTNFSDSTEEMKFQVVLDIAGFGTTIPTSDTKEMAFKRYNAPLSEIEDNTGNTFLEKCYKWVMLQPDMVDSKEA
jgi:hypothetical protein